MLRKVFLVCTSAFYYKNRIFDLHSPYNRDNAWHPMWVLQQEFKKHGVDLQTYDYWQQADTDYALLFSDYSELDNQHLDGKVKKYLIITESEIIAPANWQLANHHKFAKIFTWRDDFVDDKKYFKVNFSQKIIKEIDKDITHKNAFCALISANKINSHPLELYSKRVEAINWFEENHLDDFDLYGFGWDKYVSPNRYINYLLSKLRLSSLFAHKYKSYKGVVASKKDTLSKYKFAICYENARDIPGYITEKIFDCFFAACVPVYLGPDNITDHVPANCFIDQRDFSSFAALYDYMKNMSDSSYMEYLDNIERFLNSEEVYPFSSEYFAKTMVEQIVGDHQK